MEDTNQKFVYHGSPIEFNSDHAIPKKHKRGKWNESTKSYEIIFDQESFHATPYKWIALAYTYKSKPIEIEDKKTYYNIAVSLYQHIKEVEIFGLNSLEESLKILYGEGGYLYTFDKNIFIHKKGLGRLEVISEKPIKPLKIEKIENPVEEMKKLGVVFKFVDLALPENKEHRD